MSDCPNLIWFLTPNDLVATICNDDNWHNIFCRSFQGQPLEEVREILEPIGSIRNRWAHFRPVSPDESKEKLDAIYHCLYKPIADWTAEYWNGSDSARSIATCEEIAEGLRQYDEDAIPVIVRPLAGYHSGFLEPGSSDDRGWVLFIQLNESETTLWAEPTAIGMTNNFGLSDAIRYATLLRERIDDELHDYAVHVAANFEEEEP